MLAETQPAVVSQLDNYSESVQSDIHVTFSDVEPSETDDHPESDQNIEPISTAGGETIQKQPNSRKKFFSGENKFSQTLSTLFKDSDSDTVASEIAIHAADTAMRSELTPQERQLLKSIRNVSSARKKRHAKNVTRNRGYNKLLGVVVQVLTLLGGSAGIGSLVGLDPSNQEFSTIFVISIISLLAALFATLQRSLGFENKTNSHRTSVTEYGGIANKIAHFLSTPETRRKDIEIFISQTMIEYSIAEQNEEL
jgi:hypothetical protein